MPRPSAVGMNRRRCTRVLGLMGWMAAIGLVVTACGATGGNDTATDVPSATTARGAELFANNCARCHGQDLAGTDQGPPLIHEFYIPSHHGDQAFLQAVRQGVQPHHWNFGPMPPIEGLSDEEINDIVAHVRQQQRVAGLTDGP